MPSFIADIIKIYIEVIAFFDEKEKASMNEHTRFFMDFKIIDDDLTAFILEVERHFSIKVLNDGWYTVITMGDIADLVIKYNGYATKEYKPEHLELMKKIGQFFKWLFNKR